MPLKNQQQSCAAFAKRGTHPLKRSQPSILGIGGFLLLCGACSAAVEEEIGMDQEQLGQPAASAPAPVAANVPALASTSGLGSVSASGPSIGALTATIITSIDRAAAEVSNKPFVTAFSGHGPVDRVLVKSYSYNQGLVGLRWGEDTDDPCFLEAYFRNVATEAAGSDLTFDECDGHNPGNFKTINLPQDYFATGVRVCLNSDGDKIKGVQLIGQHILCLLGADGLMTSDDGSTFNSGGGMDYNFHGDSEPHFVPCEDLVRDSVYDYHWQEHENCDGDQDGPDADWEAVVKCDGDSKLATGMKFGIEDGSGDRQMIEGIALECHSVN